MNTGMNFSNNVDKMSVKELRESINEILNSGQEQETLRCALEVLGKGVQTAPMYVSDVNLQGDTTNHHTHYPQYYSGEDEIETE